MYCGYQLKYAITVAFCFIVFGFSRTLFALGLSDISVHSNLGEPLKASVTVLGAQDLKSESCLKLGAGSDVTQVNFMLGPVHGDTAKLSLTSNHIVSEPIVNLSVIAGCNSSIERHYVLLLDPPAITNPSKSNNNDSSENLAFAQRTNDTANNIAAEPAVQNPTTSPRKTSGKKKAKRQSTAKQYKKPAATSQQDGGDAQTIETKSDNTNNPADTTTNSAKSRLSISSGSYMPSVGLRLDKKLNLNPDAYSAQPLTAEDILLEDELTVVNNRILHLQKQIDQLQAKNVKLTSDNQLKSTQLASKESTQTRLLNILLFIGIILLLILAYIAFGWLRRRQLKVQASHAKAIWSNIKKKADKPIPPPLVSTEEIKPSEEDDTDDDILPPAPANAFKSIDEEQLVIEDDQTFSVLDHADVFLFHGRASLAIQLLQNYLIEHPKQSVTIWLFLLDLLAKENLPDVYEQTAADCKLYYNIKIPDFSQSDTESLESLENFPRLAQGLTEIWNTPNALIYLDDLIYNNRLTPRVGLPKNLIEELTLLRAIAQENVNPADVPPLDDKKLAEIKEKEALLEKVKTEKLEAMAKTEALAKEQTAVDKKETSFEFTLSDK